MIISLITALYLLNIVNAKAAYTFLYISGILLIAGEIAFTTYGLVGANGLLALFVAYVIQTNASTMFGVPFDWSLLFGLAFVEFLVLVVSIVIVVRYRKIRSTTGTEAMVGSKASIIEWNGTSGKVLIEGESWKAKSDASLGLHKDEQVTVVAVDGLTVKIKI